MREQVWEYLKSVESECVRCGMCKRVQKAEGQVEFAYGDLAKSLLDARGIAPSESRQLTLDDIPSESVDFVRACLLCGRCTAKCPKGIRARSVGEAARAVVGLASPEILVQYRRYRCDLSDSMFNRMRDVRDVHLDEFLPKKRSDIHKSDTPRTLYFPGCTLCNNFPDLNNAVFAWLKDVGIADCTTSFCCGRPLVLMGCDDEYDAYELELCDRILQTGVTKVLTACPNCFYKLKSAFAHRQINNKVELKYLLEVLVDAGYRFAPTTAHPYKKVAIHDSCPDRHEQIIAKALRTYFENVEVVEQEHNRLTSVCCGSGGFGSVYKQTIPQSAFGLGVSDFYDTGAQCLVCACANCNSTYKSSGALQCDHYLELLFDAEIDMGAYNAAIAKLWDPAYEHYIQKYDKDEPFFTD